MNQILESLVYLLQCYYAVMCESQKYEVNFSIMVVIRGINEDCDWATVVWTGMRHSLQFWLQIWQTTMQYLIDGPVVGQTERITEKIER